MMLCLSEVKRVCFRHAVDEQSMKFSCFPKPSILGQRGSINLVSLSGNESNNVNSTTLVSLNIFQTRTAP